MGIVTVASPFTLKTELALLSSTQPLLFQLKLLNWALIPLFSQTSLSLSNSLLLLPADVKWSSNPLVIGFTFISASSTSTVNETDSPPLSIEKTTLPTG